MGNYIDRDIDNCALIVIELSPPVSIRPPADNVKWLLFVYMYIDIYLI